MMIPLGDQSDGFGPCAPSLLRGDLRQFFGRVSICGSMFWDQQYWQAPVTILAGMPSCSAKTTRIPLDFLGFHRDWTLHCGTVIARYYSGITSEANASANRVSETTVALGKPRCATERSK
jgi:hypothetical protein